MVEDGRSCSRIAQRCFSDVSNFTYAELAARINRYARWAMRIGVGSGVTVCLLMPNRPDYLACWLGITRVGGTVALINTRLVGRSLAHCIEVASADHVVLATECAEAFSSARRHLSARAAGLDIGSCGVGADLEDGAGRTGSADTRRVRAQGS